MKKLRGSGTILVVDDEEAIRELMKEMLEQSGYTVLLAENGRTGIEIFRKHKETIRCVLLDLTMPQMDGEEAFRELCRIKENVRVIISSGYTESQIEEQFAGRGPAGFMQKPYQMESLLEKFKQVLSS